mgnify:CR=1 FL=1|tara:strand:+ start:901 stop:1506 length:606 start_codon:yes stop_codon:yes gene_type:complete
MYITAMASAINYADALLATIESHLAQKVDKSDNDIDIETPPTSFLMSVDIKLAALTLEVKSAYLAWQAQSILLQSARDNHASPHLIATEKEKLDVALANAHNALKSLREHLNTCHIKPKKTLPHHMDFRVGGERFVASFTTDHTGDFILSYEGQKQMRCSLPNLPFALDKCELRSNNGSVFNLPEKTKRMIMAWVADIVGS